MSRQNVTPLAPKWLTPGEMKAWRTYIVSTRRLLESLDGDLQSHGLSLYDYEILALLSDAPERQLRMSELAHIALLSRSRLSHRIKVMEKAGWVERVSCPEDKRGFFAVMTPKGWEAIVAAAPDHVESVRRHFVDHLTLSEQSVLAGIFEKVEAALLIEVKEDEK